MGKTFIFVDANYLLWRAFHSTGKLSHGGDATGVVFGFLRDIRTLTRDFNTQKIAFCFDHGKGKRLDLFKSYKIKREEKKRTEQGKIEYLAVHKQATFLKKELPKLGFKNVFYEDGYEADDLIARLCEKISKKDDAVIVTADKDMYQLLRKNVCIWNPTKKIAYTLKQFTKDFKIDPSDWSLVKSIAGCGTDDVPGMKGVGEKTAAKFVGHCFSGNPLVMTYTDTDCRINEFIKTKKFKMNQSLVLLPFKGTPKLKMKKDKLNSKKWDKLTKSLGMQSLVGMTPGKNIGFGFTGRS